MVYLFLITKNAVRRGIIIRRRPLGIILPPRADSQADRRRPDSSRRLVEQSRHKDGKMDGFQLTVIPANMLAFANPSVSR